LKALPIIAHTIKSDSCRFARPLLPRIIALLLPYESLSGDIVKVWLPHAQHQDESWRAHQDINDVMLATALIPNMVLSLGVKSTVKAPQSNQH
jgi:hypothetical protein